MSKHFQKLIETVAKETKFIRVNMIPFFKDYIKNHQTPLVNLRRSYKISRYRNLTSIIKSNVAAYLIKKGADLISDWLNSMFYFRRTDLKVLVKGGGTTLDIVLNVSYNYNNEELKFIRDIIKQFELKDITVEDISSLFLSESVLCIQNVFNEIIGYNFTFMMQNSDATIKDGTIQVEIEIVSRLYT